MLTESPGGLCQGARLIRECGVRLCVCRALPPTRPMLCQVFARREAGARDAAEAAWAGSPPRPATPGRARPAALAALHGRAVCDTCGGWTEPTLANSFAATYRSSSSSGSPGRQRAERAGRSLPPFRSVTTSSPSAPSSSTTVLAVLVVVRAVPCLNNSPRGKRGQLPGLWRRRR